MRALRAVPKDAIILDPSAIRPKGENTTAYGMGRRRWADLIRFHLMHQDVCEADKRDLLILADQIDDS